MLRFRKNCEYCGEDMDSFDLACRNCHEENHDKAAFRCRNMAMFPFWKQILFFFTGLVGLYAIAYSLRFFLDAAGRTSASVINFGTYIILMAFMLLIIWDDYQPLLKSFKSWKPFVFGIIAYIGIYIFDLIDVNVANIVVQIFFHAQGATNQNQAAINSLVDVQPLLSLLVFGIIGPICEELTYRVGLFSFLRRINIVLAYAVTILVFASIHFSFASITNFIAGPTTQTAYVFVKEMLSLPSYIFAGAVFTFLYHKFGFAGSLTAHISNNFIGILFSTVYKWLESLR